MERECGCYVSFVPVPGALMLWVVCLSLPFQTSQACPRPCFPCIWLCERLRLGLKMQYNRALIICSVSEEGVFPGPFGKVSGRPP